MPNCSMKLNFSWSAHLFWYWCLLPSLALSFSFFFFSGISFVVALIQHSGNWFRAWFYNLDQGVFLGLFLVMWFSFVFFACSFLSVIVTFSRLEAVWISLLYRVCWPNSKPTHLLASGHEPDSNPCPSRSKYWCSLAHQSQTWDISYLWIHRVAHLLLWSH